ncbi:hypothetical protein MKEN_00549100 [Mycena kentingensis (nom. inval.)]|nr:hypothetical protein MKEN_00549100 [Mycena kentingensis (nom. inval.)]
MRRDAVIVVDRSSSSSDPPLPVDNALESRLFRIVKISIARRLRARMWTERNRDGRLVHLRMTVDPHLSATAIERPYSPCTLPALESVHHELGDVRPELARVGVGT